jgi:hypothetical protein
VRRLLTAGAALVAVLAGCASPIPGTPVPMADDPAAVVDLPPRPRVVPVDGVDPCTLLTEADRAELRLDFEPVLDVNTSELYNGGVTQLCSIRSSEPGVGSVGVNLSVTGGIELFLRPRVPAVLTATEVAGFPALVADPTRFTEFCNVVVDVAPQQAVDVGVRNAGNVPALPEAELCREAERVAGIVMNNLLARG